MEDEPAAGSRHAKKRRIPKACSACRKSKLRCDEKKPCSRCTKAAIECVYFERPKDSNAERIERLERDLSDLRHQLGSSEPVGSAQHSPSISYSIGSAVNVAQESPFSYGRERNGVSHQQHPDQQGYIHPADDHNPGALVEFTIRRPSTVDVVTSGSVSGIDARAWFSTFFEGCDRFVLVFDAGQDTFDSIRGRSSILFDVIVLFGARAAHGVLSKAYQELHGLLRQHTSDLVLRVSGTAGHNVSIEDIQALLVIASYSDSGAVLCDVALRAALEAGVQQRIDALFSAQRAYSFQSAEVGKSLLQYGRVWYYLFILDMILSIDGGKPPSISIPVASARRVRVLLNHPHRTALDIRLFAQVELNSLRASAHNSITAAAIELDPEGAASRVLERAILDFDLWLSEWQSLVLSDSNAGPEQSILSLNVQIQYTWAILTIHLRALTASEIENIAVMTEKQRTIVLSAKSAAERHLQLLLTVAGNSAATGSSLQIPQRPYIANFRYAMEFVWAKNAFCVLIVLRLSILLGDPPNQLLARLSEAKEFLQELDKIGMGANVSYTRIMAQTVEKCERAVQASLQSSNGTSADSSESDFQSFIPKEFMFNWDFPGLRLHLAYLPLDWTELFFDFDATTQ